MLIIELSYKKPLDEVEKFLAAHRSFLDKYYSEGVFIASGPKNPRNGGVILALGDKETLSNIIKEDPFHQQDIAEYRIIQFEPNRYTPLFESAIKEH